MRVISREALQALRERYPKGTRVELVQMDDGINIRRASSIPHRTLEERLTAFYGKPIDQIDRIEAEELDWGKAEGSEAW
mgnify:CR=1 FL=1